MKNTKLLFAMIFCSFLLLSSTFMASAAGLDRLPGNRTTFHLIKGLYCKKKCDGRCAKAGVKDRCIRYCNICCAECKCVPSGTYGNKHQCPCYRDKKNSKGKPKCP